VEKNNVVINEVVSVEEPPKVETEDKVTSIEGIKTKNQSVITNEVLSVEEFPKVEFKKQFNDKETSTDLVKVDIPLITTDEVIGQSKDVVTPVNTKTSDIIMTTQVNHDKTKPKIKKDKIIRVPYRHQITKFVVCKNQHTNIPRFLTRVNGDYISKHPKIYVP
jgi:hypothetical protein